MLCPEYSHFVLLLHLCTNIRIVWQKRRNDRRKIKQIKYSVLCFQKNKFAYIKHQASIVSFNQNICNKIEELLYWKKNVGAFLWTIIHVGRKISYTRFIAQNCNNVPRCLYCRSVATISTPICISFIRATLKLFYFRYSKIPVLCLHDLSLAILRLILIFCSKYLTFCFQQLENYIILSNDLD